MTRATAVLHGCCWAAALCDVSHSALPGSFRSNSNQCGTGVHFKLWRKARSMSPISGCPGLARVNVHSAGVFL